MPQNLRNIEYNTFNETILHPLALVLLIIMLVWVVKANAKNIFYPLLVIGLIITPLQRLAFGSFDITLLRIMLFAVMTRALLRKDYNNIILNRMDIYFIIYIMILSLTFVILRRTVDAFINRMGFALDALLGYFLFRIYIKNLDYLKMLVKGISIMAFIVSIFMAIEVITRYNMFHVFGGVREFTWIREGRLRAQGAFPHPILAGSFGAVFVPIAWSLRYFGKLSDKIWSNLGIIGGIIMTLASSSSGPILSLFASVFALSILRFRDYTKQLFFLSILGLIGLSFIMDAPVWHLIARVDVVGGSTGWHRYALIDSAIRNLSEWFLFGVLTTGHWGWGLNDVTNMYVLQAVRGGIFTLILFIFVLKEGYKNVNLKMKHCENPNLQKIYWAWGCALFSHCVTFIGVSYFGQMDFFWYLTLGVIASIPGIVSKTEDIYIKSIVQR